MSRTRVDPSTPESPQVTVNITIAVRDRLTGLAAERGISRSAVMRALIESALASLDAEAAG
jgi:hypothetical protein